MNKFLIGAAIGGLVSYLGHRQMMKAASSIKQFSKACEFDFNAPPKTERKKTNLHVVR